MQFKENYFGYHQKLTDMQTAGERTTPNTRSTKLGASTDPSHPLDASRTPGTMEFTEMDTSKFDPRVYRPLAVKIALTLHDIHGHLVKVSVWLYDLRRRWLQLLYNRFPLLVLTIELYAL